MAIKKKNLSDVSDQNLKSIENKKIGIVVSEWNHNITSSLHKACKETLVQYGAAAADIKTIEVPGAFELPLGAKMLMGSQYFDAIICLGCVIQGETKHDEYISHAVSKGIMGLNLASGTPIIFGLLTPNSMEQAEERAGGKHGNKGVEAATTAIKMINIKAALKHKEKSIGF